MSRRAQINIRVSQEEKKAWEQISRQHDMPVSEIARRFLNAMAAGKIKTIPIVPRPLMEIQTSVCLTRD
ncbi:MAG: hypothetical protein AB1656_04930 [Candidatus Omnitrophota bacterium]